MEVVLNLTYAFFFRYGIAAFICQNFIKKK